MLGWTLIFLIIALVAGVFGFTAIAGAACGNRAGAILYLSDFIFGVNHSTALCQMMPHHATRI